MTIRELLEFVGNDKNKMLKQEQMQTLMQKKLEVKDYISIKEKKLIIEDIISECIMYEDGIYKFDDIKKYIYFIMKTIEAYTNIELSYDIEDDYDMLCSAGILEMIIGIFKKEYDDINILLSMRCDYILSGNSINAQVGKFLNELSDKLDVIIDSASNKIDKFDINNLSINKKDLMKLMDFINLQK